MCYCSVLFILFRFVVMFHCDSLDFIIVVWMNILFVTVINIAL